MHLRNSGQDILSLMSLWFLLSLSACRDTPTLHRNKSFANIPMDRVVEGERLAKRYCQSCHLMPGPELADASSWVNGILPNMGPRLGIFFHGMASYPSKRFDRDLDSNIYPSEPLLTESEWQLILDYYSATSPDAPDEHVEQPQMTIDSALFFVKAPAFSYKNSTTSFLKIDTGKNAYALISCDVRSHYAYLYDDNLSLLDSIPFPGPIVNMEFRGAEVIACNIGVLNPNNGKYGEVIPGSTDRKGKLSFEAKPLFENLQRPVQATAADLDMDGKTDYLICEFGYITGALSWMQATDTGFVKHILKPLPGAINAYINDYNNDGMPDIMVLFAQGDESVMLFTNKGNGIFSETKLLRFPPSYGSSYFEMDDFNNDGFPDILYTCGDNADYSTILKPYHGVYIFLNDGHFNFTQKYFYHINGCYKAMAADFDKDGDLDIATISYFADYAHHPEEGFVYLQNTGEVNFKPIEIPGSIVGRWLTMDVGDVDGDGWKDIVLGNFAIGPVIGKPANGWKDAPPILLLKNKGKR